MAYKTCENCGCRVFNYGCVNCDEQEYIDMQEDYQTDESISPIKNLTEEGFD